MYFNCDFLPSVSDKLKGIPLSITKPVISNNAHKKYNQIANDGIYAVIPNQRVCFSYWTRDLHVAT